MRSIISIMRRIIEMDGRRGPVVLVHGGAGLFDPEMLPDCIAGVEKAAKEGMQALERGALAAAVVAVRSLELNENFNAGLGSTLTTEGTVELDASVMTGDLAFGAIGACPPIESAVEAAAAVLAHREHIFYVGDAAAAFADSRGIKRLGDRDLVTARALGRWEVARASGAGSMDQALQAVHEHVEGGTVGAVALDFDGNLAAATSTGGRLFKRPGRVGDTPVLGAGTYADDESGGAASATGEGEAIMRVLLCRMAVEALKTKSASEATELAMRELSRRVAGKAGIVLIDKQGFASTLWNTENMPWALCRRGDEPISGH